MPLPHHLKRKQTGQTSNATKKPVVRKKPPLQARVLKYAAHQLKHAANGFKVASQEEINARLDTCAACPTKQFKSGYCMRCGCKCNSSRVALLNLLASAVSKCPDGHW